MRPVTGDRWAALVDVGETKLDAGTRVATGQADMVWDSGVRCMHAAFCEPCCGQKMARQSAG